MSKTVQLDLTCPHCQKGWKATVYRSIWIEFQENLNLILNDRINVVNCPSCGFSDRLPLAFLATNAGKRAAIWYEPCPDPHIDSDLALYRRHYGDDSFYTKAERVQDWTEFKRRLVKLNNEPHVPATMEDLAWITKGLKSSASEIVRQRPKTHPDKVDKIARLVDELQAKGHKVPSRVAEISGFPCQAFDDLRAKLSTRELILYRPGLSYSPDAFALMATRRESATFYISVFLMFVLPFLAVALAIFVHWPWILACPFLVYAGWRRARSAYTRTIFRSAVESEMNFCFLFYGYKVGVALPDFSKVFVWEAFHPDRP